jgi:hypothetical protein
MQAKKIDIKKKVQDTDKSVTKNTTTKPEKKEKSKK